MSVSRYKLDASIAVSDMARAKEFYEGKLGSSAEHYEGVTTDEKGMSPRAGGGKVAWLKDPDGNTFAVEGGYRARGAPIQVGEGLQSDRVASQECGWPMEAGARRGRRELGRAHGRRARADAARDGRDNDGPHGGVDALPRPRLGPLERDGCLDADSDGRCHRTVGGGARRGHRDFCPRSST
jgi:catechol 2,3-dioxygenase-like lactoylglutathione lyase family enzyme